MTSTKYSDLVDVSKLQALMESFNDVIGIANAVIDVDGTVIAQAGWQDACVGYHRVNPETGRRCIESDTSLVEHMTLGEPYAIYRCHNGLVEAAAPIIVDGVHLANVFTGQFQTEAPDMEFFRQQSRQFGFDEARYLEAISRIPILDQGRAESLTRLYANLAGMLASSGADRLAQKQAANDLASLNAVLEESVATRTRALQESEDRSRLMFERNDCVMLLIEPDSGEIVDANASASRFYGYSIEQLKAMKIDELNTLPPDEIAQLHAEAVNRDRNFFVFSHRIASGETRTVEVRSSPVEMEHRVLLFSIVQDITGRMRMEESLQAREIELSTVIDSEPECVKQLAADCTLLQMNRAGLNMVEAESLDQVRGQNMLPLLMPEHRDAFMRLTERVFAGESGNLIFEIRGLKGSRRWLETHAVPLRTPHGRIISSLSITRDITERKKMEDEIRQLAFYDPLTQLPNRRLIDDRLIQTMASTKRTSCYGALIFVDLDNFKRLNDLQGHDAGDSLLIEVAGRIQSCVREIDTVGRFGGDEFVVILRELNSSKEASVAQAGLVAEKIRTALSEPYRSTICRDGKVNTDIRHGCTASIGVALFIGHDASREDILNRADSAMYKAKEAGRNSIQFHSF